MRKNTTQKFNWQKLPWNTHKWNTKRKMTLFGGITIVLILFISTIWIFDIYAKELNSALDDISKDKSLKIAFESFYNAGYRPSLLGLFWKITSTFTWISNLALGISLILYAIYPKNWIAQRAIFLTNVYITITFLVFWTLIFPTRISQKTFPWQKFIVDALTHLINPIIGFVFLIINRKNIKITRLTIILSNIVIICYFVFALIVFFIGEQVVQKAQEILGQNIREKNVHHAFNNTIYKFLNFRKPLFYSGNSLVVKISLNIVVFILASSLTPFIGYIWYKTLKLKKDMVTKPYMVE
ncbi:hypothetical protein V2E24_03515 [Mycoplasmopsis ciconiae]|uniref:Integral membrane protein n=1 Tax=Mycoplasmopsis ciconiae TaxID=561067 RepID=A0ABU7MM66_9BACT|nr:hypothetical protein [Mycoplasmopsis ciconiae]